MIYFRRIALFALLCFQLSSASPQNTSSRIIVESGGNIPFNVNSLKKYSEGIGLTNWTRLSISFLDTTNAGVPTTATWKLEVKANASTMFGDYGETLELDYLVLNIADASITSLPDGTINSNDIFVSDVFQPLVTGAPQGEYILNISYRLGTEVELLGHPPDYYFVDLIFEISKWAD